MLQILIKKGVYFFIVGILLFAQSCAVMFTGSKDKITFNSKPDGVSIYKNGELLCKTPCTTKIKRSLFEVDLEFRLDGYETKVITLDRTFNLVSILNLGNAIGWAIDLGTGAVMKYDKKGYDIPMFKVGTKGSFVRPSKIDIDTVNKTVEIYVPAK